ncbi:TPA: hypothetical protein DCR49_01310 [Candidatus Delongbacteria bacterium]|nr:hypothetical protein [Candidatus Delongbacteria bacterium]
MKDKIITSALLFMIITFIVGCASSKSDLGMAYKGEVKRNPNTEKVSVFFVFSHVRQMVGLDAIPKLENKYQRLNGFDDIFLEAQREFSNLGKYATYVEESSDVNNPVKRAERDSLMKTHDYTIKMRIEAKKKFTNYFLGYLFSTISLTVIPVPYSQEYTVKTDVLDSSNRLVGSYERKATLKNWSQVLLIFVYPFHPEFRKIEEIYMAFLKDTFRQIESEGILRK